jgi:hypothetical protein
VLQHCDIAVRGIKYSSGAAQRQEGTVGNC